MSEKLELENPVTILDRNKQTQDFNTICLYEQLMPHGLFYANE